MPPPRHKPPVTSRDEKRRAIRLLESDTTFPELSFRLVRYMGIRTLRDPAFHMRQADISRRIFSDPLPDEIFEAHHKRRVDKLLQDTREALARHELRPESKISAYRICLDKGDRSTGLRLSFEKRRTRPAVKAKVARDSRGAALFWRRMIETIDARTILLVYDTPEIGMADPSRERLGWWAGSGEVAAAFLLGQCLAGIDRPVRVKRWRDMDHADLTDPGQCLIILGSSLINPWLRRLRERERWIDLQTFHFEASRGEESRGCIRKGPLRAGSASDDKLFEHRLATDGTDETDYALISCFHDTRYRQTLIALQGITSTGTHAAAAFMCGDESVEELHGFLHGRHACNLKERSHSFEAVLELHVNDGLPVDIGLVDSVVYGLPDTPRASD